MIIGPCPRRRFDARSGEVSVAYAVVGDGPIDVVLVTGWILSSLIDNAGTPDWLDQRLQVFAPSMPDTLEIDVRHVLAAINVPTLVVNRTDDDDTVIDETRYIAARIPGSDFVELPGRDSTAVSPARSTI